MTQWRRHIYRSPWIATACLAAGLGIAALPAFGESGRSGNQGNLLPNGEFESGRLGGVIHWRSSSDDVELTQKNAASGEWSLRLRGDDAACTSVPAAVTPDRKYSLTFMAKVDGPGVIATEAPDALERIRHTKGLPRWRLDFRNEEAAEEKLSRGFPQFYTKIVHGQWTEYREDFYPPPDADQVQVVFINSGENELMIDDVRLVPLAQEPLNLNPDVSLGPLNFTGYGYVHQARIVQKDNGSDDGYLDTTEGWVIGDPIPVEQRRYRFSFRGRAAETGERVGTRLRYTDAELNKVGQLTAHSLRIEEAEWTDRSYEFIPPSEVHFIRIIAGGGHHDWFRIEEVEHAPSPHSQGQ